MGLQSLACKLTTQLQVILVTYGVYSVNVSLKSDLARAVQIGNVLKVRWIAKAFQFKSVRIVG